MPDQFEEEIRTVKITGDDPREWHLWNRIANDFHELVREANKFFKTFGREPAYGFSIYGTGDSMPTNNTITAGQTGTFTAVTVPSGGLLAPGAIPVWSSSDPLTSLTPDSTGLNVAVATSASDTAANFTLTLTGINSNGVSITGTLLVTLAQGVATGTPAASFAISQVS
jgi:hypothetical protein